MASGGVITLNSGHLNNRIDIENRNLFSGVHPKLTQAIMRHSDINLTMSLYTHTFWDQESEAVKNLPDLSLPRKVSQKTYGTEGKVVVTNSNTYKKLAKNFYFDGLQTSLIGTNDKSKILVIITMKLFISLQI